MKLWGGRFESGPSEVFERFGRSLDYDKRLIEADLLGSLAHARGLRSAGVLSDDECQKLLEALESLLEQAKDPAFFDGCVEEDVHTVVIRKLKERVGADLADKIHTGRSRNDQVSLDVRLWLRGQIDQARQRLVQLMRELLALAQRYPEAIIPGYTHTRRAQPVLWPHYVLAYFEMFARDWERLGQARRSVNVMPLGSGALAGSGFPIDREAIARELGFDSITRNSMDGSGDRDFLLDFEHAANLTMLHLSRLAEDWILYTSEEFGWMDLGDGVTSGSSMMPQKRNPDSLELIRGKAGRVFGAYLALLVTLKALPMTYNRDMQEDKEPLFDVVSQLLQSLEMACAVVPTVTLKPDLALRAVEQSWAVATDLADALARQGLPFHQAHQIVGRLVLESIKQGRSAKDWSGAELAAFAPEFKPEMAALLDPREAIKTRVVFGGTAPERVAEALAEAEQRLSQMQS
ncbi:MAG: argininosuccinate lyase [Bryobacteraceae bacterium]|nr:argininosuccinate lyase [Bryobacteraceae bacterium]MDW8377753.1 argininosuccinate lyase [Bryobacterales bacterium]